MASTSHLWRTTRVNTRRNSTRASVAAVLRAERVRAAAAGAAATGITSSSLDYVGAGALPRTKRVVAFDEAVTVHILPYDEYEDAEAARTIDDNGFCTVCQAPIVSEERRNWKSAWGLGLVLRQVDELESRQSGSVCVCEHSRYPEYGGGSTDVVVDGEDDEDEDESTEKPVDADETRDLMLVPAPPSTHSSQNGPVLAIEAAPFVKRLGGLEEPAPYPPVPRERALRFQSRSRSRNRGNNSSAFPRTGTPPALTAGPMSHLFEEKETPLQIEAGVTVTEESYVPQFGFSFDPSRGFAVGDVPSKNAVGYRARVSSLNDSSTLSTPMLSDDEDSPELEKQLKLVASRSHPSRLQAPDSSASATRIAPSLSEIRRQMLDEMETEEETSDGSLNPRMRTLPAPVLRAPRPTPGARISSMSDVDGDDRPTTDIVLRKNSGAESSGCRVIALSNTSSNAYPPQINAVDTKQLSHLTPIQGSPSDDSSRDESNAPSMGTVSRNASRGDMHSSMDGRSGSELSFSPPIMSILDNSDKLSPSAYATKRTAAVSNGAMEIGSLPTGSSTVAVTDSLGLSTSSAPVTQEEELQPTQGRLRFRGRRARAAAAAEARKAAATAQGIGENTVGLQPVVSNIRKGNVRERSFAGFGGRELCGLGGRDASELSTAGTGFVERREEFSVRTLHHKTPFTRSVKTDLGHLGHIQAERNEKQVNPRRLTSLRNLRERVTRLVRQRSKPESSGGVSMSTTVGGKVSRQLCMSHDAEN